LANRFVEEINGQITYSRAYEVIQWACTSVTADAPQLFDYQRRSRYL
jgi:hypothetical protein